MCLMHNPYKYFKTSDFNTVICLKSGFWSPLPGIPCTSLQHSVFLGNSDRVRQQMVCSVYTVCCLLVLSRRKLQTEGWERVTQTTTPASEWQTERHKFPTPHSAHTQTRPVRHFR